MKGLVSRRPAESASLGLGAAGAVAYLLGLRDPHALEAIAIASSALPAVVTQVVAHGGVRGVVMLLWRGRR